MADGGSGDGDREWVMEGALILYDIASALAIVGLVVGFVFAISGLWPPLVAIESGSMDPHIQKGDLAFVMDESRFPAEGAIGGTGVITHQQARQTGHESFQRPGDVIVYEPDGDEDATPIIHRAMFYVEDGENWVERGNESLLTSSVDCDSLSTCPAPHDGFITSGDSSRNDYYDQSRSLSTVVKPEWVKGRAMGRIPFLGKIRLQTNALRAQL